MGGASSRRSWSGCWRSSRRRGRPNASGGQPMSTASSRPCPCRPSRHIQRRLPTTRLRTFARRRIPTGTRMRSWAAIGMPPTSPTWCSWKPTTMIRRPPPWPGRRTASFSPRRHGVLPQPLPCRPAGTPCLRPRMGLAPSNLQILRHGHYARRRARPDARRVQALTLAAACSRTALRFRTLGDAACRRAVEDMPCISRHPAHARSRWRSRR